MSGIFWVCMIFVDALKSLYEVFKNAHKRFTVALKRTGNVIYVVRNTGVPSPKRGEHSFVLKVRA